MKYPSQHKWRQNNPKQTWAHQCLRSAIKRGLVIQAACESCGDPNSEAHHPDYDRPMDVQWLCRACHKAEHRRMKQGGGK